MGGMVDTVAANFVDQDLSRSVLPQYETGDSRNETYQEMKVEDVRVKYTVLTAGRVRRLWSANGCQGCCTLDGRAGATAKRVVVATTRRENTKERRKEGERGGKRREQRSDCDRSYDHSKLEKQRTNAGCLRVQQYVDTAGSREGRKEKGRMVEERKSSK